jgi:hypothetical protein
MVGVGVIVGVSVLVGDSVIVGVSVAVGLGVLVGVAVGDDVTVGVGVKVGVGVGVARKEMFSGALQENRMNAAPTNHRTLKDFFISVIGVFYPQN